MSSLVNPRTGSYVNDAVVTVSVTDRTGTTLTGPHAMDYISDSDGRYVGIIPIITDSFDGQRVIVVVEATAGSGYGFYGKWQEPVIFDTRRATDLDCC